MACPSPTKRRWCLSRWVSCAHEREILPYCLEPAAAKIPFNSTKHQLFRKTEHEENLHAEEIPAGQIAAYVAVALAIPALFIFVMIHHGRNPSRAVSAQSVGLAAPKAAPAELRLDQLRQATAGV